MSLFNRRSSKPLWFYVPSFSRVAAVCLAAALLFQLTVPLQASVVHAESQPVIQEASDAYTDKLIFGQAASENAHRFSGAFTSSIVGLLGESARVSNPRAPLEGQGGDLTFTMEVDPAEQNYLTVKFSGDDVSNYVSAININGEQIGYLRKGDYEAINMGMSKSLPNRFYYNTTMLPLESTFGRSKVEITIKTLNASGKMEAISRGYYNAYTHTQAYLNVEGEQQGEKLTQHAASILLPDKTEAEKQALLSGYTQGQIDLFNSYSARMDNSAAGKLSIVRYQDELRFYANSLHYDWSPANTAALKKAALERIFKTIDNHVKDYYGDTRLVLRGGHQGDWGGYYGALGEALYIVENFIHDDGVYGDAAYEAFLDQPFVTGTIEGPFSLAGVDGEGGQLTRREAWERVLKANFDFARARLSNIYNQILYTYEGAWEAHEGLRLVGSSFYEGKERSHQILLEALGARPFLGEEVLVGPSGEELDLYHSLFYHDATAQFTDDFVQIVGKGLAQSKLDAEGKVVRRLPLGEHFTGISEAGLTRENNYVANYGEAANYLPEYVFKTAEHAGDEQLNDEILKLALKNLHVRGYTRYTSLDDDGKRIMRMEQVTDERNPGLPGVYGYATRHSEGKALLYASLEKYMIRNEQNYTGPEWEATWQYAKEAVGYVQQQLADHQLFNHFAAIKNKVDYQVADTYRYVTADRAQYDRFDSAIAGVVHPQTDFNYYTEQEIAELGVDPSDYEQFAWVDLDNLFISLKDGDTTIFGALNERNRGFAGNGRLHVMNADHDNIVQVATNGKFQYEDYYLRLDNVDVDFMSDQMTNVSGAPQALAGEIAPVTYQPGVGTVVRDNFEVDHAYSGYPDLLTARYGSYFMIFNTTRDDFGNQQTFEVEMPADYLGNTVLDLLSGQSVPIENGKVTVAHKSAMVLKLTAAAELAPKPLHVDFANALAGNGYAEVSWKTTSGGQSYTITRSESENGSYEVIASGVTGNAYKDTTAQNGSTYYYKVAAVNDNGAGWDSYRAKVVLAAPVSIVAETVWRDDQLGSSTTGTATVNGDSIAIASANGSGLGDGDDYKPDGRAIHDSLHFVNQTAAGSFATSARMDSHAGSASGIMLREALASNTRYIYFGADASGKLVLQNRTRNSQHQWSNLKASPLNAGLQGYQAADYPYIKLVRDYASQSVSAFVSKDGEAWEFVRKMFTPFAYAVYTGVVSAEQAQFSEATVEKIQSDTIAPYIIKAKDQVTVYWNKPKQAAFFQLYRTNDAAASAINPVFKAGTLELEDGSPWTVVAAGTRQTSYKEASLKYGSVHYKVLAIYGDGSASPFSAAVSAYADGLALVLAEAEEQPAKDYTRASFYLFHKELDRIKAEMTKPDFDEEQLIHEIYAAKKELVSFRTLLTKIPLVPAMVKASTKGYGNDNISEAQNGWYAFDGSLDTFSNARLAESWIDVDFGEGNEKVVDTVRYHGRTNYVNRVNSSIVQGSQDGMNWTDLLVFTGASEYKFYSGINNDSTAFRYLRIYDNHAGYSNYAEIEWLEIGKDATLLAYLLNEAARLNDELYTSESLAALADAAPVAQAAADNPNATQEELDEAAAVLLTAMEGLHYLEGVPVLAPIGDKTIIAGQSIAFQVHETRGIEGVELGVENLPAGATFNTENGKFAWVPAKEQGGIHEVTLTASAGGKTSSITTRLIVKGQPLIAMDTEAALTATQAYTYNVVASDPTGEAIVLSVNHLPAGAVFDPVTGLFSWTPGQLDAGNYSVVFQASNGFYNVSQKLDLKVGFHILPPALYTKGSYYRYMKMVSLIEEELKQPDADKKQLAAQLAQAELTLVALATIAAEKINIAASMVAASTVSWDNSAGAAENGWRAFDGSLTTFTDTKNNPSWIRIDLGQGKEESMGSIRFYPRSTHITRVNGAIFQGSNDDANWINLHTISGVSKAEWHSVPIAEEQSFRYLRYYSAANNSNVAEIEFYQKVKDRTLLSLLLAESLAVDTELYTEESIAAMQEKRTQAAAVAADASQAEIDAASDALLTALEILKLIGQQVVVDISELEAALNQASSVVDSVYTPESIAHLNIVVAAAEPLLASAEATQEEVDTATANVLSALASLIVREQEAIMALRTGGTHALVDRKLQLTAEAADLVSAFTHEGILYSKDDFDRAKQRVAAGVSPWIEAWNAGKSTSFASASYTPNPVPAPARWGGHPELNAGNSQLFNDSESSLVQAIIWKVSSNAAEANQAKLKAQQILDAWSSTVNTPVGGDENQLLAGLTGYRFAATADLLKDDSAWVNAGKLTAAKQMLGNYFYPPLHNFLLNHQGKNNGTAFPYYYRGNQDIAAMVSIMAIGVLLDDTAMYNEAVDAFKNGNHNGRVTNYLRTTSDPNLAQSEESGRDQPHTQLGIGLLATMAQISYYQHKKDSSYEDLYEYSNRIILKGAEYTAKYLKGGTVPFTPIYTYDWRNEPVVSPSGREQIRPIYNMIWSHYHGVKGLADAEAADPVYNTKALVATTQPEGIQTDHQPFTTLLYTQSPVLSGETYVLMNPNSGKVLDVASGGTADGTNVQIWQNNSGDHQRFTVTGNSDGTYRLINVKSGKALDVSGKGTANGTNVQIWSYNGGVNQSWKIVDNADGTFKLMDVNSGKALDVTGNGTANGTNVQIWTDNGGPSQKWRFSRV